MGDDDRNELNIHGKFSIPSRILGASLLVLSGYSADNLLGLSDRLLGAPECVRTAADLERSIGQWERWAADVVAALPEPQRAAFGATRPASFQSVD